MTFEEASQKNKWRKATKEEINSINKNNIKELTSLFKDHKTIRVKWVFKTKRNANGDIEKHKVRLVVKG